ncbi:unnamed protein product, partial [Allacma fusca]
MHRRFCLRRGQHKNSDHSPWGHLCKTYCSIKKSR